MARILVVDDDADIRSMLETALQLAGHEVHVAPDGRQAIESYQRAPADVVVLDIFMPEKEGIETLLELRQRFANAKIIVMSGGGRLGTRDFLAHAAQLGAARTIAKPFDHATMVALVEDVLST